MACVLSGTNFNTISFRSKVRVLEDLDSHRSESCKIIYKTSFPQFFIVLKVSQMYLHQFITCKSFIKLETVSYESEIITNNVNSFLFYYLIHVNNSQSNSKCCNIRQV